MALDLGFLAQAAARGLAGYRQGQRLGREDEDERNRNLFAEWARRRQLELQGQAQQTPFRLREMDLQAETARREAIRKALEGLGLSGPQATAGAEVPGLADNLLPKPETPQRGQVVQGNTGEFTVVDPYQLGPTGVTGRLPGQGTGDGMPRPRNIPAGEAGRIAGVKGLVDIAESAKARVADMQKRGVNASGPFYGNTIVGGLGKKLGRIPQEVVDLWSSLANIGSREMLERSGAAVTPHEFDRLEPHLPRQQDTEEVLLTKLDAFIREVQLIQEHRMNALEDANYDMSRFRAREAGAAPSRRPLSEVIRRPPQ